MLTTYQATPEEIRWFTWRTQEGELIRPSEMEDRHLFMTLKMIWNHSAPEKMKLRPYQQYRFPAFYTPIYMAVAIQALGAELLSRYDRLPAEYQAALRFMKQAISGNLIQERV